MRTDDYTAITSKPPQPRGEKSSAYAVPKTMACVDAFTGEKSKDHLDLAIQIAIVGMWTNATFWRY